MWNLSSNKLPRSISSVFNKNVMPISGHEYDFVLPVINTEIKRRFISFNGVKIWAKVPNNLKRLKNFISLKKNLQSIYSLLMLDSKQILCTYLLLKYVNPKLDFLPTKLIFLKE